MYNLAVKAEKVKFPIKFASHCVGRPIFLEREINLPIIQLGLNVASMEAVTNILQRFTFIPCNLVR